MQTPNDIPAYQKAWTEMMLHIWEEKLLLLGIYDTGALVGSLQGDVSGDIMKMRFMEYGIYVDAGVGNGYRRGNGGNLEFLDDTYRIEHGLGRRRVPRPWFSKKFFASVMKLKDDLAKIIGDDFIGIVQSIGKR